MSLVEVKNVSVFYKIGVKSIVALSDVSFEVGQGEYIFVVGENGTGKSTLIKAILNLVPVDKGKIKLNCKNQDISYVPQINTIPMDFPASVYEIVLSGTQRPGVLPFYQKKDHKSANEIINFTGLTPFKNRRIRELSGGQQQRVLLARAIAKKPKILALDEPCCGLDEKNSNNFYALLEKLNKQDGTTIIMASHDLDKIEKYAKRIIKLNHKMELDLPKEEYIKRHLNTCKEHHCI